MVSFDGRVSSRMSLRIWKACAHNRANDFSAEHDAFWSDDHVQNQYSMKSPAGYRSDISNACWSCFVGVSEARESWSKMSNNKSGRCLHRGCWHTAKVHHSVLSQICRFKLEFKILQPDEGWVTSVQTVLATSTQLSFPSTCITILSKSGRKKKLWILPASLSRPLVHSPSL